MREEYLDTAPAPERCQQTEDASIWTTKDGRRIRIAEMADQHLINTIRMLRGKCRDTSADDAYFYEPDLAEHALDAFYQERDQHFDKPAPPPQFAVLCAEAERRGLSC